MLCRLALLATLGCATAVPQTDAVEFNRDIRPILSDRCYACHGPDRQAEEQIAARYGGWRQERTRRPFRYCARDAAGSEMIRRVTSSDMARRMPPAYSGAARLTDREIGLLTRWIAQGAPWQKHWSFIPPVRPALPAVHEPGWPKNPIDDFVLARLEREGLKPSAEADRGP